MALSVAALLDSRRVAETMSHKIIAMNHGQGFSANCATGILVIFTGVSGLPGSTTHVSAGALFGIGLTTHQAEDRTHSNALATILPINDYASSPCAGRSAF